MVNIELILSRHGESEVNSTGGIETPKSNSPLTERGLAQARRLALQLEESSIGIIYSSDSDRSIATARKVAEPHNLDIVVDKRLREYDAGDFYYVDQGFRKFNDYKLSISKERGISPLEVVPPSGESEMQHYKRVKFFLEDIENDDFENIVVVGHSGTNKVLFIAAGIYNWNQRYGLPQDNCCINRLSYGCSIWKLLNLNETNHLRE